MRRTIWKLYVRSWHRGVATGNWPVAFVLIHRPAINILELRFAAKVTLIHRNTKRSMSMHHCNQVVRALTRSSCEACTQCKLEHYGRLPKGQSSLLLLINTHVLKRQRWELDMLLWRSHLSGSPRDFAGYYRATTFAFGAIAMVHEFKGSDSGILINVCLFLSNLLIVVTDLLSVSGI